MNRRNIAIIMMLSASLLLMAGGKRVLFIGDSITDGAWGNSKVWNTPSAQRNHNDMNHIYGHGYMMIAASHYEALYPEKGWTFWNRGISGNTLDDLAARWQDDVLALKPDIVSILIGTNDVDKALREGRGIDTVEWAARLGGLLDKVREENPQARFVLCTPFVAKAGKIGEREDYDERKRMIQEICDVIKETGERYHATMVPFDELVEKTVSSTPELPTSYWIWDGIHPTPAMHYRMAKMWIECACKELLR